MADWLDDIPGVKDVVDGTGAVDVTQPRRARVRVSGDGVTVSDDPVDGVTDVTITAAPGTLATAGQEPVDVDTNAAVLGVGTAAARWDHKHDVGVAAPVSIGTANSAGIATSLTRSDHVHAHAAQTDGTLHAAATTSVNGFQSAADKLKQDATSVARSTAQTTDGTPTALATITPADETQVTIRATVNGLQSDGANGAGYVILGTFRRDGGTTVQVGTTTAVHTAEDAALSGAVCAFNVATPAVQALVTGIVATTINWACVLEIATVP